MAKYKIKSVTGSLDILQEFLGEGNKKEQIFESYQDAEQFAESTGLKNYKIEPIDG